MILEVAWEVISFTAPWAVAALIALFAEMVMET
jgi:hypothetical protein